MRWRGEGLATSIDCLMVGIIIYPIFGSNSDEVHNYIIFMVMSNIIMFHINSFYVSIEYVCTALCQY